jgi:hypothetical protein
MSHSQGAVLFTDSTTLWCEYNGTVDIMLPNLFVTNDELHASWRKQVWASPCKCKGEKVRVATSYGGGFSWDGKACRLHKVLLDGYQPHPYNEDEDSHYEDGEPEWFTKLIKETFK